MTWNALRHQNIMPLLGVSMGGSQFAMVSDWMGNGNINEFVKAHRNVNRFELVGSYSCRPQMPLMIPSDSSGMLLGA